MAEGERVVVALSGGSDSTTLLHLLCFARELPRIRPVAVHVDHRMRPDSQRDAEWVRGLCRGWGVPLRVMVLDPPPAGEADARRARYAALERARREAGASSVLTAHHADDQAETVLFRILRGAGPRGLRGILERRAPAVVRPLLPFRRRDLQAYARAVGLRGLEDPTNRDPGFARNRIRGELLPLAEAVVPGATRSLARLAWIMDQEREGWEAALDGAADRVVVERSDARIVVARTPFLAYHSAVRAGLLLRWLEALGAPGAGASVRAILEAVSTAPSGRRFMLPGGVELRREFDRLLLVRPEPVDDDAPLAILAPGVGEGEVCVGGRRYRVAWGVGDGPPAGTGGIGVWLERFQRGGLRFPLLLRARRPGDRIRTSGGTRRVKKVLAEAGVPLGDRARRPVLMDAEGRILWIPGVGRCAGASGGEDGFWIRVADADAF